MWTFFMEYDMFRVDKVHDRHQSQLIIPYPLLGQLRVASDLVKNERKIILLICRAPMFELCIMANSPLW